MHPTICMKEENIMLTFLIPGPTAPSNNIDVYLSPLIDDLNDLWNEGIVVYDLFQKENITLKIMLLWIVSDYPGLGTLAGCKVKGKQACTICGKDTPFRWLKFTRKHVYLGNRKRLRPEHPYRRRRKLFDNKVKEGTLSRIQNGSESFETLKDISLIEIGFRLTMLCGRLRTVELPMKPSACVDPMPEILHIRRTWLHSTELLKIHTPRLPYVSDSTLQV
ncbi:hypothetical protein YC2023_024422 [Brassica napus]